MSSSSQSSKMTILGGATTGRWWTLVATLLTLLCHEVSMVRLASLRIPRYTIHGQPVRLECHYDLENEALYSVKWYKDGKEFFRFLPGDNPPAQTFDLPGFSVNLLNSTDNVVMLENVGLSASGVYRCEVSGEAPAFQTVVQSSHMMVVDLPDDGPLIEGGRPRYSIDDTVRINCTSARAKPAAKLVWHINGEVADERLIRKFPVIIDEDGLETAVLGLQFQIKRKHFRNRDLKIKCVAKIEDFYWRTNEESVLQDHPEKGPVMESKSTFDSEFSSNLSSSTGLKMSSSTIINFLLLSFVLQQMISVSALHLGTGSTSRSSKM